MKCGTQYVQDATSGTLADTAPATPFEVTVGGTGTVISGLALDKTYTVEEVAVTGLNTGYTCEASYSPASFESTSTSKTGTIAITNTYAYTAPAKGTLTVTKAETGTTDGSGKPSSYQFYVKCGTQYVQDATSGTLADTAPATPFEVTVGGTGTVISGLALDKTYTVEEVAVTGLNTGYTCEASYSPASFEPTSTSKTGTIAITNTYAYTSTTGSLSITKSVVNNTTAVIPTVFKIAVKNSAGNYITATDGTIGDTTAVYFDVSASVGNDGTVEILNLVPDTYTIEEDETEAMSNVDPALYSLSVSGTGNIDVVAGNESNATVINSYSSNSTATGVSLTVNKTINGYTGTTGAFSFVIKEATNGYVENITAATASDPATVTYTQSQDDAKRFSVSAGTPAVIDGLENGTYSVEEVGNPSIDGYDFAGCSYSSDSIDMTAGNGDVTITNTYTEKVVSLTVKKTVTADEGTPASRVYEFKVRRSDNLYVNRADDGSISYDANGSVFSLTPGDTGVAVINGLKPNTYTIVEDTAADKVNVDGYTFVSATSPSADCTNGNGTAELTNTYQKIKKGSLIVTKTISADHGTPAVTKVIVTITNEAGKYLKADGTLSDTKVTIDLPVNGTAGTITIANVPDGKYTVTEELSSVEVADYQFDKTSSTTSVPGLELSATSSPTAALVNAYKKTTELQISKVEAFGHGSIQGATLQIQDNSGKVLHQWVSTTSVEKFKVPDGTYRIHEVTPPTGHKLGLDVTFTVDNGTLTIVSGADGKINDNGEIEFKNDPIKVTGDLDIHVIEKDSDGKPVPDAEVEVTGPFDGPGVLGTRRFRTNQNGYIFDDNGNEVLKVTPGKYTFKVTKVPDGYKITTGDGGDVDVPENGSGHGLKEIIPAGGLTIIVVEEGSDYIPVPGATVEIIKPDGTKENKKTDSEGKIKDYENTEVGEYKVTVIEVPDGYKVTVGKQQKVTVIQKDIKKLIAKIDKKNPGDDIPAQENTPSVTPTSNQQTTNGQVFSLSTKKTVTDSMTSARTGESKAPFFVFGGSMASLLVGAIIYIAITKKKREEEDTKPLSLK